MKTTVQIRHVPMEHNVSIRKEATSAFVQKQWLVIRTRAVVSWKKDRSKASVEGMRTAPMPWLVSGELVSAPAAACSAELTPTANRRSTLRGAAAELVLLKDPMVIVFLNATVTCVDMAPCV